MKLATAYVELAARTDVFRRQLHDATRLAESAGRQISRSLQISESPRTATSEPPDRSDVGGNGSFHRGHSRSTSSRDPGGLPGLLATVFANRDALSNPGTSAMQSSAQDRIETSLLKQQVELSRKEIDILQKQLEALRELRHGVPAVMV